MSEDTTAEIFERVADRVIDAELRSFVTITQAALLENMSPEVAIDMWIEKFVKTHGGDPAHV